MSTTFIIKRGDTRPVFEAYLQEQDGTPLVIDGATVRLIVRGRQGVLINRAVMVIVDAATALVRYSWAVGDTATPGTLEAECEVTFADGGVETIPNEGYIPVRINGDLG